MTALATSSSLERFSNLAIKKTENVDVKEFATKVAEKAKACKDKLTAYALEEKIGLLAGTEKGRQAAYTAMVPVLDRYASKGLIHKNKAARHKSRLTDRIKAIG